MKTQFTILIVLLFAAASCSSPSRLIKNERYDEAIEKVSRKIRGGKIKSVDLALLEQAYHTANQADHDRIRLLRASENPDIWPEVFSLYQAMNNRQAKVKALPSEVKNAVNFVPIDLVPEINEAKTKAQRYLYAKAEALLKTDSRADARQAFVVLNDLKRISPDYPQIDQRMREALLKGTNQVLILFDNQTGMPLPAEFEQELLNFSMKEFDGEFVRYDLIEQKNVVYDYTIYATLKQIVLSPERMENRRFTEQKEIEDGKQPKRDENGNVMLDSTGKVIEVTKYRVIEAIVNETILLKNALLRGSVDFVDNAARRTIHTTPLEATSNFAHSFAVVNGDLKACTPETLEMMRRGPVPFPPDGALILDAAQQMNQLLRRIIRNESGLMKSADR
jgi:hypothetical protein